MDTTEPHEMVGEFHCDVCNGTPQNRLHQTEPPDEIERALQLARDLLLDLERERGYSRSYATLLADNDDDAIVIEEAAALWKRKLEEFIV